MALSNAQLAQQISELVDYWRTRDVQFAEWLGGTPTGGPYGDGRYPLTDYLGVIQYLFCPAALESGVTSSASSAAAQAALAGASKDAALTAQAAAESARALADQYRAEALAARDLALQYRDGAANHEANALAHRNAAQTARTGAETAEANAETAQAAAEVARDAAQASASAASSSATAAANSATLAATFEPSLYARLASAETVSGAWNFSTAPTIAGISARNATLFNTGTLADARLSTNVPLKNVANTFTGALSVSQTSVTPLSLERTGSGVNVNLAFKHTGATKYLGISSTGALRFGDTSDLNSVGIDIVLGNDARLTDARTPLAHTHAATDITSGTLADARLPTTMGGKTFTGNIVMRAATDGQALITFNSSNVSYPGQLQGLFEEDGWGLSTAPLIRWRRGSTSPGPEGFLFTQFDAPANAIYVLPALGFGVGNPTGGLKGAGSINAQSIYQNNVAVVLADDTRLTGLQAALDAKAALSGASFSGDVDVKGQVVLGDRGGAGHRFRGTEWDTHFHYGASEHTYIRPGKSIGNVYMDTGASVSISPPVTMSSTLTTGGIITSNSDIYAAGGFRWATNTDFWIYNTSGYTYGSWRIGGARNGYVGLVIDDGGRKPTLMSNGSSSGVYNQGSSYWSWYDDGSYFHIGKTPMVEGRGGVLHYADTFSQGRFFVRQGGSAIGSQEGDVTLIW